jgi:hypothetical protein
VKTKKKNYNNNKNWLTKNWFDKIWIAPDRLDDVWGYFEPISLDGPSWTEEDGIDVNAIMPIF